MSLRQRASDLFWQLVDWLFLIKLWPLICKRVAAKMEPQSDDEHPVLKYEKFLQAIHDDKLKNKPGVYVFVAKTTELASSLLTAEWSHGGFILGKDVALSVESQKVSFTFIMNILLKSRSFAVGRLEMSNERAGRILGDLRAFHKGSNAPYPDLGGTGLVKTMCKDDIVIVGPDDLYAAMTVLYEHRGRGD